MTIEISVLNQVHCFIHLYKGVHKGIQCIYLKCLTTSMLNRIKFKIHLITHEINMICLQFLRKNHNNIPDIKFVRAIFKMMHVLKLNHSLQNKCKIIYCFHHQNIKLDWKLLQHRSFSNFLLS